VLNFLALFALLYFTTSAGQKKGSLGSVNGWRTILLRHYPNPLTKQGKERFGNVKPRPRYIGTTPRCARILLRYPYKIIDALAIELNHSVRWRSQEWRDSFSWNPECRRTVREERNDKATGVMPSTPSPQDLIVQAMTNLSLLK